MQEESRRIRERPITRPSRGVAFVFTEAIVYSIPQKTLLPRPFNRATNQRVPRRKRDRNVVQACRSIPSVPWTRWMRASPGVFKILLVSGRAFGRLRGKWRKNVGEKAEWRGRGGWTLARWWNKGKVEEETGEDVPLWRGQKRGGWRTSKDTSLSNISTATKAPYSRNLPTQPCNTLSILCLPLLFWSRVYTGCFPFKRSRRYVSQQQTYIFSAPAWATCKGILHAIMIISRRIDFTFQPFASRRFLFFPPGRVETQRFEADDISLENISKIV